jgi:hypothetical protein
MVIPHTEAMEADWLAMQQMQRCPVGCGSNDGDDVESYHAKDEARRRNLRN